MARVTRDLLKTYFVTGAKPSQEQFENLIDSLLHVEDSLGGSLSTYYATLAEAGLGTSATALMTPFLTKHAIVELVRVANIPGLRAEIDAIIQGIVGAAPASLNTLQELASALNNDQDLAARLTTMMAQKANLFHSHDDRYYTERELDAFFEGIADGKQQVHWDRITNKPYLLTGSHRHLGSEVVGNSLWNPDRQGEIFRFNDIGPTIGTVSSRALVTVNGDGVAGDGVLQAKHVDAKGGYLRSTKGLHVGDVPVISERGRVAGSQIEGRNLWSPFGENRPMFAHQRYRRSRDGTEIDLVSFLSYTSDASSNAPSGLGSTSVDTMYADEIHFRDFYAGFGSSYRVDIDGQGYQGVQWIDEGSMIPGTYTSPPVRYVPNGLVTQTNRINLKPVNFSAVRHGRRVSVHAVLRATFSQAEFDGRESTINQVVHPSTASGAIVFVFRASSRREILPIFTYTGLALNAVFHMNMLRGECYIVVDGVKKVLARVTSLGMYSQGGVTSPANAELVAMTSSDSGGTSSGLVSTLPISGVTAALHPIYFDAEYYHATSAFLRIRT